MGQFYFGLMDKAKGTGYKLSPVENDCRKSASHRNAGKRRGREKNLTLKNENF